MKRTKEKQIRDWFYADQPILLVTGVRQSGKTTLIRELGKDVPGYAELSMRILRDRIFFEDHFPEDDFFEKIVQYKGLSTGVRTLLFIDDISDSSNALQWIREVRPPDGWKIIAASPREVADIASVRIFPFSFHEFLIAMEEESLVRSYEEVPYAPHDFGKLIRMFHLYSLIGGMPEVVTLYSETRELADLAPVYEKIQDIFEDEIEGSPFSGNVRERSKITLQNAFPFATERISFSHFASSGSGSREISRTMKLLQEMMLLTLVYPVTETSPLKIRPDARLRSKHSPRLHLPDTGLINYFTAVQEEVFATNDLMNLFNGQIIRHITGQEIAASGNPLSFWIRPKPQSEAAVDYILSYEGLTIPVVVKKGEPGRLRSLFQFMDSCNHPFAVRLWDEQPQVRQVVTLTGRKFFLLSLPFFLAGKISEYLPGFIRLVQT